MDFELTRRDVISVLSGGFGALVFSRFASRPAVAVSSLSLNATGDSITTSDGTLSDVLIAGTSTVTIEWEDFDSTESGALSVEARASDAAANSDVGAAAKTFETVIQTSVTLTASGGSNTDTFENYFGSTTFPVGIVANHSGLSASDFTATADGGSNVTELEIRLRCTAPSASATNTDTATIDVTNIEDEGFGQGGFGSGGFGY
jgi:hypothetical protein